jgi:hypothetical protein
MAVSASYESTLAKLAATATAASASPNEREVARAKFERVAGRHGITLTVEEFLAGRLREVTDIQVSRNGSREAWSLGNRATGWNPLRFEHVPCPHGCGALVYLVPKSGTKRTFVNVTDGRIGQAEWSFGRFDTLILDYHDDTCPEVARKLREARELEKKRRDEMQAAYAATRAAHEATIAADPTIRDREERELRARHRMIEASSRHGAQARKKAKAAAEAAEAAYWREIEAKPERTRRWREANPERARQLNREAQARWRARQKVAKAATTVTVTDRP